MWLFHKCRMRIPWYPSYSKKDKEVPIQVAGLVCLGPDLNHHSVTKMSPPYHPPPTPQWQLAESCRLRVEQHAFQLHLQETCKPSCSHSLAATVKASPFGTPQWETGSGASSPWPNPSAHMNLLKALREKSCFPWLGLGFLALKRIL